MTEHSSDASSLLAPLWRRKWMVIIVAVLAAGATYAYTKSEAPEYSATTTLYFGGASEQQNATGSSSKGTTVTGRQLADQVGLIQSAVIGLPVRAKLRAEHDHAAVKGKISAKASGSSDFVTLTSEAKSPRAARNLANTYAAVYIERQRREYEKKLHQQIAADRSQLHRIENLAVSKGKGKSSAPTPSSQIAAANLQTKISQLEANLASFAGVQQTGPAKSNPLPVSPKPKQDAIFGFVLGLILAMVAAFALDRTDRKVRTLGSVQEAFDTQILAALPTVNAPLVRPDGSRQPAKLLVEPLRRLHTTLQLQGSRNGSGHGPHVLLVLSPDAGDGRSSLIANLARVQADAGERVVVVEADFRRPAQERMLGAEGMHGLADVLEGRAELDRALRSVPLTGEAAGPEPEAGGDEGVQDASLPRPLGGSLELLAGGGKVSNPPALLASDAMSELIKELGERYDWVLIDSPPPLEVSDAMPLLRIVDGVLLLARLGHTSDTTATRLNQLLHDTVGAPVLGAIANCVPRRAIGRYGFAYETVGASPRGLLRR